MAVQSGDILSGKYRLESTIGRGGMGEVYSAIDLSAPDREVAVKVVRRAHVDHVLIARLHREIAAASRIRSDFVPRVLDVSETDEGELFFVMERLVGESLSERLRAKGPLGWDEVERIGSDVLRGLIDAHTAGIVHRDLKPSNVFLTTKDGLPRAMVLDFGICKMDVPDTEHLTSTGEALGTIAYMAPEQIRGAAHVDDRADLYAFGVLVFEMLSRSLPHAGPNQMAILASKLENPAERLRDAAKVPIPSGLDELVTKVLSRDPGARFASAQELLKAWRNIGTSDVNASQSRTAWTATNSQGSFVVPTVASSHASNLEETASEIDPPTAETSFTAGISLRNVGRRGRVAYALSAFGLACGIVATAVAAFRKGPMPSPTNEAIVTTAAASPVVPVSPSEPMDPIAAPLASAAPSASSASVVPDAGGTHATRPTRRARPLPAPVGRPRREPAIAPAPAPAPNASSEPRLITRPRY